MKSLLIAALALPLAGVAYGQSADMSSYTDVDDVNVVGSDGEQIGEIETVVLDDSGEPVAFVVEVDDGFLDLGDSEVVVQIGDMTWENGEFTTDMTEDDIEGLPTWDD